MLLSHKWLTHIYYLILKIPLERIDAQTAASGNSAETDFNVPYKKEFLVAIYKRNSKN
jgi:hypothetical protein